MSVRWKPLVILCALFSLFGAGGLLTFLAVRSSTSVEQIVAQARSAVESKQFEHAKIHYERALQVDGRDAELHAEVARFYGTWEPNAPEAKRAELKLRRRAALQNAAKYDPRALEPRRSLYAEAVREGDTLARVLWAKQILAIDPNDAPSHYTLADEALSTTPPNLAEAAKHLAKLDQLAPERSTTYWIRAELSRLSNDRAAFDAAALKARNRADADEPTEERLARVRIATRVAELALDSESITRLGENSRRLLESSETPLGVVVEVNERVGRVRDALQAPDSKVEPELRKVALGKLAEVEGVLDQAFTRAFADRARVPFGVYVAYAETLARRGDRDACLKQVQDALALPAAREAAIASDALRLRVTGAKAALAKVDDTERMAKAQPFIRGLIESSIPEFQGLGHLFQGAVELEQLGIGGGELDQQNQQAADHLARAREHLGLASKRLPKVSTAQALYGMALMQSREQALGRQYLLSALKLGGLEPKYQVWAAWSMLQAGYPEEAAPIVAGLEAAVNAGALPRELEPTLLMMSAEVSRARATPAELARAKASYERVLTTSKDEPAAAALRIAQLTIEAEGPEKGLEKLRELKAAGKGGTSIDPMIVRTLLALGKVDEARAELTEARTRSPKSIELASIEAEMLVEAKKGEEAVALLESFGRDNPTNPTVAQLRARILVDPLDRVEEARKVLTAAAESSGNSAPLVQLALLDLSRNRWADVEATIAKVRQRWPEAASSDLLEAQLAMARDDLARASTLLDASLQKDPTNKVAQFWKAQLDDRLGATARATEAYKRLVSEQPVKELASGLSLTTASQWALASLALENKEYDRAIAQFQQILAEAEAMGGEGDNPLSRAVRWKLATAHDQKGDWTAARKELYQLLTSPLVTLDERVQAAEFYRRNGDPKASEAQLAFVLKTKPDHSGALVTRAFGLADQEKRDEARTLVRQAIERSKQPAAVYLMLAGLENSGDDDTKAKKAALSVVDEGLAQHPADLDLIRAKFNLLRDSGRIDDGFKFVDDLAKEDKTHRVTRLLVDLCRDERRFDRAEEVVRGLIESEPSDQTLKAVQIGLLAANAAQLKQQGDPQAARAVEAKLESLLTSYRQKYPKDVRFPEAACEIAMRAGDFTKAESLSREIDTIAPDRAIGATLRARIFAAQGLLEQAARSYSEALTKQSDSTTLRVMLAQTLLELGRAGEALEQADRVVQQDPGLPAGRLVKARALTAQPGSEETRGRRIDEAIALLSDGLSKRPDWVEGAQLLATLQEQTGQGDRAIATLEATLKAEPDDLEALAQLVSLLATAPEGSSPSADRQTRLEAIRSDVESRDRDGGMLAALAQGYRTAGLIEPALAAIEKAAEKKSSAAIALMLGDLLLTLAETKADTGESEAYLKRALGAYDQVLKADPTSIEAVNNKAWILHEHLKSNEEALALVNDLARKVNEASLPAEFFDTQGSILEALGRKDDAAAAYVKGLKRVPDNAVLNYHMGRLMAGDRRTKLKAEGYLQKAREQAAALAPEMVTEVDDLLRRVSAP